MDFGQLLKLCGKSLRMILIVVKGLFNFFEEFVLASNFIQGLVLMTCTLIHLITFDNVMTLSKLFKTINNKDLNNSYKAGKSSWILVRENDKLSLVGFEKKLHKRMINLTSNCAARRSKRCKAGDTFAFSWKSAKFNGRLSFIGHDYDKVIILHLVTLVSSISGDEFVENEVEFDTLEVQTWGSWYSAKWGYLLSTVAEARKGKMMFHFFRIIIAYMNYFSPYFSAWSTMNRSFSLIKMCKCQPMFRTWKVSFAGSNFHIISH